MRPLVPTALALAGHPMPRCADTRGIYAGLVDILYQAGHDTHLSAGAGGLRRAARILTAAKRIEQQLTAEIASTVGTTPCRNGKRGAAQTPWPPC